MDHLCAVCQGGHTQGMTLLCTHCAHPERVRTYCTKCGGRLDFTPEEALTFFQEHLELVVDRPGTVFKLDGCEVCMPGAAPLPHESFTLDNDHFPPCQVA